MSNDNAADLVNGAGRLIELLGRWPSFHDAEVVRLSLDREGIDGPSLHLAIHLFEVSAEVGPSGPYVRKNHTLVTFRFVDVAMTDLRGFNQQNVLFNLRFERLNSDEHDGRHLGVTLESSFGLEGSFGCSRCAIADIEPYEFQS